MTNMARYSQEELDRHIDAALAADTPLVFERAVGPSDGKISRLLWGIACGYRKYAPADDLPPRAGPPSFGELTIIRWATHVDSSGVPRRPDCTYLAGVMRRPVEEVLAMVAEYGPAQGRGAGFGLKV